MTFSETNQQIARVMQLVQEQLREVVAGREKGHVVFEPLPYFDGHLGKWEGGKTTSEDINKLPAP